VIVRPEFKERAREKRHEEREAEKQRRDRKRELKEGESITESSDRDSSPVASFRPKSGMSSDIDSEMIVNSTSDQRPMPLLGAGLNNLSSSSASSFLPPSNPLSRATQFHSDSSVSSDSHLFYTSLMQPSIILSPATPSFVEERWLKEIYDYYTDEGFSEEVALLRECIRYFDGTKGDGEIMRKVGCTRKQWRKMLERFSPDLIVVIHP
jgi:hypothetical protein